MRLSVLDQSAVVTGRPAADSIRESLSLARHAEALGYHRYWVAEHHNSAAIAGSAPEILIAAIAATTTRIRVGSAGVMLPHYASLKVAEQFRVLEAIAPGRIDLGVGRAPGGDGLTAHALNPNAATAADRFPAQLRDLLAWVSGEKLMENHPFRDVVAMPSGAGGPELWMLGSSGYGAQLAAHFGLPYCFAHFITDGHGAAEALDMYRARYQPSRRGPAPWGAVCVWALAADTAAAAERQFSSRALWRLGRDRGVYGPLPSPAEAAAYAYSAAEREQVERLKRHSIFGTGPDVAARLLALAQSLGVQEVAILTATHDPEPRRRSYELLAREFRLLAEGPAAGGRPGHAAG
jgi:luciferase family oxidoreductase group 1